VLVVPVVFGHLAHVCAASEHRRAVDKAVEGCEILSRGNNRRMRLMLAQVPGEERDRAGIEVSECLLQVLRAQIDRGNVCARFG